MSVQCRRTAALAIFSAMLISATAASADPQHAPPHDGRSAAQEAHYPGPGGGRIPYQTGYYMNGQHQRQAYTYPSDWQQYGHPRNWYQSHSHWNEPNHQDWYRGQRGH